MSTVKAKNHQIGNDGTASNNFTIYQPSTPDGTSRWAVGVSGATTADVVTVTNAGNVNIGQTSTPSGWGVQAKVSVKQSSSSGGAGFLAFSSTNENAIFLGYDSTNSLGRIGVSYGSTGSFTPLVFETGGSERMRIDSSGNLLVGKTTTSNSTAGTLIGGLADLGYMTLSRSQTTNADITLQVYSTGASANRFYVGMGGTVYATSTTITGISDQRVKENIVDLDDGLDAVMALKPRKFDWKEGKGKNIKGDRGFIAQEFETVFPDMIEEWKDPAPEGEEPYKAVNANLIPILVKAIQEQQTIIETLKADIAELKAKVN